MKTLYYNSVTRSFSQVRKFAKNPGGDITIGGMNFITVDTAKSYEDTEGYDAEQGIFRGMRGDSLVIDEDRASKLHRWLENKVGDGDFKSSGKEKLGSGVTKTKVSTPYGQVTCIYDNGYGMYIAGKSIVEKLVEACKDY